MILERAEAEQQYTITAFDYVKNPVGSSEWCIYWEGWKARANLSKPQPTSQDAERFYDLGFKASGEGHNGEHGANINGDYYLSNRKEAINAAMKEGK